MNGHTSLIDELSDPNHPLRLREWNAFLERRQMLFDDIVSKIGLGMATQGMGFGLNPITAVDALAETSARRRQELMDSLGGRIDDRGVPVGMRQRDYQQTIGEALLYQIEDPESIPFGQLQQMIEEARVRRKSGEGPSEEELFEFVALTGGAMPAFGRGTPVYIGGVDSLMRVAETIPFIGDFVSDREATKATNQWLGMLREAHLGALSEDEISGARLMEAGGNILGYIAPGIAAWRVAGFLMGAANIGGITRAATTIRGNEIIQTAEKAWGLMARNPILHRSIQGGVAELMLEAGGDGPILERATNIAIGTGMGAAFGAGGQAASGAAGGLVGGIMGESIDRPIEGIAIGVATGLGLHRAYRTFTREAGVNNASQGQWFESHAPGTVSPARMLQPGVTGRAPRIIPEPRGLPPGPSRRALSAAPEQGLLPAQGELTTAIERNTWRGTRTLFYSGREAPDELMERWSTLERQGFAGPDQVYGDNIILDNTGKVGSAASHISEVEVSFDNLFVLTPDQTSIAAFNSLTRGAQDAGSIQTALKNQGFDGLAVQGVDDLLRMIDPEDGAAIDRIGIPGSILADQVIAFGTPFQVKYSRPIVDGDLLEAAGEQYGMDAVRQVAGVQAATFSREASRQLRPFEVGEAAERLKPMWLSEQRGLMYQREAGGEAHPLVPDNITHAVVQNHETLGPRLVLLDADRVSHATIPLNSFDEGIESLARIGFQPLPANSVVEATKLAAQLSNGDLFVNTSMAHILGQVPNPTAYDLIPISYADNPGRVSLVSDFGDPFELARRLPELNERYGVALDRDKNIVVVERPAGTFHALIGPEDMITPKIAQQFKEFGVFSGMEAGSAGGSTIRVNSVWRDKGRVRASVSPIFSDIKATVPIDYVIPGRTSVQQPLTGGVYNKFKKFAVGKFNTEAKAAGLPVATDLADPRVLSLVDKYIDDFGSSQGLSLFDLGRFSDALEWNLAQDIRKLAGEEGQIFDKILKDSAASLSQATREGRLVVPDMEELAVLKGFIWEPPNRGRPGQLVDQTSNLVVPFDTKQSAMAFLRGFHRSEPERTIGDMAYGAAFTGFDSAAIKTPARGMEFPSERVEAVAKEDAIRNSRKQFDKLADDAETFVAAMDAIAAEPPAGAGQPPRQPPPPVRTGGGPTTPPPDDASDALVKRVTTALDQRRQRVKVDDIEGLITQLKGLSTNVIHGLDELMHSPHIYLSAPTRIATAIFDDYFRRHGIARPTMFRDFSALLDAKSIATNEAAPWIKEMHDITSVFKRSDDRNGRLYEVMTASTEPHPTLMNLFGWPDERSLLMDQFNFTPEQRQAVGALRDWMNRIRSSGTDAGMPIGWIFDYLPRLRYYLDLHGDKGWRAWADSLPDDLKWFALHARDGNLQSFQKHVTRVLESYVRGYVFEKHVKVPFERVKAQWQRPDLPGPIQDYTGNLLYVVRHGHPAGHDMAVKGVTSAINTLLRYVGKVPGAPKVQVTKDEVLSVAGQGFMLQYRNLIGNLVSTVTRELYQPMLMAPQIGVEKMITGYAKFVTDPEIRRVWTERATAKGWAESSRNVVVNSEFFTGELRDMRGDPGFAKEIMEGREQMARLWDPIYDRLPSRIKRGITNVPGLDPMWLYRTYGTGPGRVIASNTAYENAMVAIGRWRNGDIDYTKMLRESDAANKRWSIRQEFIEALEDQDWDKAASVMGREGAATQFYGGIAEQSEAIRNSGVIGRAVMQFMNFSNQFLWSTLVETKHRQWGSKIKYMATLGTLATLPYMIGRQLGWDEMGRHFNWFLSLAAGGGIMVDPMANLIYSNTAVRKFIAGEPLSPEEQFAIARFRDVWGDALRTMNPTGHAGTARTVLGYLDAFGADNPAEAVARVTFTGRSQDAGLARGLESFTDQMIEQTRNRYDPTTFPANELNLSPDERDRFNFLLDSIGYDVRSGVTPQELQRMTEEALGSGHGSMQ